MRCASVIHDGRPLAVVIDGDHATPLRGVAEIGRETPASLLREPPLDDGSLPLGELTFRPVVPSPGKVFCVGLNYLAHIQETQREESDYLGDGDVVAVEIERVGRIENRMVSEG